MRYVGFTQGVTLFFGLLAKKRDSITDCRDDHDISYLSTRRRELDILFLRKIGAGLFDVCWASE